MTAVKGPFIFLKEIEQELIKYPNVLGYSPQKVASPQLFATSMIISSKETINSAFNSQKLISQISNLIKNEDLLEKMYNRYEDLYPELLISSVQFTIKSNFVVFCVVYEYCCFGANYEIF